MPVTISKVSDIVVKTSGKTASQTRTTPIILHSDDQGLSSWSMLGNGKQNGTPSPDNIVMPELMGVRTGNLAPPLTEWVDGYVADSGTISAPSGNNKEKSSDYISVNAGAAYTFSIENGFPSGMGVSWRAIGWYKQDKTFISRTSGYSGDALSTAAPSNAVFCRLSYRTYGRTTNPMLNLGSTALPYESYGWAEKITCAGQTVPVYLGQTQTMRRIKKLVLTGTEHINIPNVTNLRIPLGFTLTQRSIDTISLINSHFIVNGSSENSAENQNDYTSRFGIDRNVLWLFVPKSFFTVEISVSNCKDQFREYLVQQYAAGTPVTVWYVLAEPTTAIVNEPLAKIGDYADQLSSTDAGVTIPTVEGENTLTVETSLQPSSMTITYNSPEYSKCVRVCDAQGRPSLGIHFGFKIDKSKTYSDQAIIYTHDAVTMTPAYMDFTNGVFNYGSWGNVWFVKNARPCKLNYNGTVAYYLDPNDYTKKADGTDSGIFYTLLDEEPYDWSTQWKQYYHLDNGEYVLNSGAEAPTFAEDTYYRLDAYSDHYMVEFPKVYFKRYEDENYNYVEISDRKLDPYFHAYAHINADGEELDYIYLPMFKGSFSGSDDALMSIPGIVPSGGTTASFEVEGAEANGDGWQIWDHSSREMINDLLVLMSKNADCQAKFGNGRESGYNASDTVTYGKLQTGTLIKKGAFYGYNTSYSDVKVFHIEGFWANRWEHLQGLLLVDGVYKIKMTPPYNFTGTDFVTLSAPSPTSNSYVRTLATSEYGSVTATVSAYASSPFKDYFYQNQSGTRVGLVGGNCDNGSRGGPRCVYLVNGASYTSWNIGASPIYKPLL